MHILFSDELEVVISLAFIEEHIGKFCIRMLLTRMSDSLVHLSDRTGSEKCSVLCEDVESS